MQPLSFHPPHRTLASATQETLVVLSTAFRCPPLLFTRRRSIDSEGTRDALPANVSPGTLLKTLGTGSRLQYRPPSFASLPGPLTLPGILFPLPTTKFGPGTDTFYGRRTCAGSSTKADSDTPRRHLPNSQAPRTPRAIFLGGRLPPRFIQSCWRLATPPVPDIGGETPR